MIAFIKIVFGHPWDLVVKMWPDAWVSKCRVMLLDHYANPPLGA